MHSNQTPSPPPRIMSINDLPEDALMTIWSYLDPAERMAIERVSKSWQHISHRSLAGVRSLALINERGPEGCMSSDPLKSDQIQLDEINQKHKLELDGKSQVIRLRGSNPDEASHIIKQVLERCGKLAVIRLFGLDLYRHTMDELVDYVHDRNVESFSFAGGRLLPYDRWESSRISTERWTAWSAKLSGCKYLQFDVKDRYTDDFAALTNKLHNIKVCKTCQRCFHQPPIFLAYSQYLCALAISIWIFGYRSTPATLVHKPSRTCLGNRRI